MLRPREHSDESPKDELESTLGVLRRKVWNRRRFSDDELQFRNKVCNEPAVLAQRITKRLAPFAQLRLVLAEQGTDEVLKGLRQRGIRDVALVLIELAGAEKAARRHQHLVQLVNHRGLADA